MRKPFIVSILLLFIFIATGIFLSTQKMLWSDELYTQTNIENTSYLGLIKGDIIKEEGNPCPLFYLNQKALFSTLKYKFPLPTVSEFNIYEPASQIIIRILPIIYMSLGLAFTFYYFSQVYSMRTGIMSLLILLSNPMVWWFWAEGRPYSLLFLLSLIQCALLVSIIKTPDKSKATLWLCLIHLLLSLTIIFSAVQILLVSTIVVLVEKTHKKKVIITSTISIMNCYYYYNLTKHVYPLIPPNIINNVTDTFQRTSVDLNYTLNHFFSTPITLNVPLSWLLMLGFYLAFSVYHWKNKINPAAKEGKIFLGIFMCLIVFSVFIIESISRYCNGMVDAVPNRYFVFLTPYALFLLIFANADFNKSYNDPLSRGIVLTVYLGGIIVTALNTCMLFITYGFY